ncbi:hypothetical protein FQN52_009426 [Onygenales sp. PD_12]|nr:hypothetical protein FQN52_009426 [Onygenales sp. PD_12]
MALLPSSFFSSVEQIPGLPRKLRWYMVLIVTLSAMNYPDEIPNAWQHFTKHYLARLEPEERLIAARKIREALTKSVGIVGAAKTGTSIRLLSTVTPDELKDQESFRDKEDASTASARGKVLHTKIYGRNPLFNPQATVDASPDYAFVIRGIAAQFSSLLRILLIGSLSRLGVLTSHEPDLFYGRIFSFDEILDDVETGHIIISALIGIDCHPQMKHHMIGLLINGQSREDIEQTRSLCYGVADLLGVKFRHPKGQIPEVPVASEG